MRDDVIGVAGGDFGDRQHRLFRGGDVTGDDGLQGGGELAGDQHRVDTAFRAGAVGAFAVDGDVEERAAGQRRAGGDGELADRQAGPIMHAVNPVARETFEQAIFQHGQRAAGAFLTGLEDEVDRAVKIAVLGEVFGGAEQHGGVAVMAAGMHAAGDLAAMRQVGFFVHRQAVHIGAQADGGGAGAFAQHADHAGAANAAMHFNAPGCELLGDDFGGAEFFQPQFGVGVQVPADGGEFVVIAADSVENGHQKVPQIRVTPRARKASQ